MELPREVHPPLPVVVLFRRARSSWRMFACFLRFVAIAGVGIELIVVVQRAALWHPQARLTLEDQSPRRTHSKSSNISPSDWRHSAPLRTLKPRLRTLPCCPSRCGKEDRDWTTRLGLKNHVETHSPGQLGGQVPTKWLEDQSLLVCRVCSRLISTRNRPC